MIRAKSRFAWIDFSLFLTLRRYGASTFGLEDSDVRQADHLSNGAGCRRRTSGYTLSLMLLSGWLLHKGIVLVIADILALIEDRTFSPSDANRLIAAIESRVNAELKIPAMSPEDVDPQELRRLLSNVPGDTSEPISSSHDESTQASAIDSEGEQKQNPGRQ